MRKNARDLKALCASREYKFARLNRKRWGMSGNGSAPLKRKITQAIPSGFGNVVGRSSNSKYHVEHVNNAVCNTNECTKSRIENRPEVWPCFLRQEMRTRRHGKNVAHSPKCTISCLQEGETNTQRDRARSLFLSPPTREAKAGRAAPTGTRTGEIPLIE